MVRRRCRIWYRYRYLSHSVWSAKGDDREKESFQLIKARISRASYKQQPKKAYINLSNGKKEN